MAESNVRIVLSAEDKATATMNKVAQSFKQYQREYESIAQFTARQKAEADALAKSQQALSKSTDDASKSTQGLFTTFTAASLAAEGIMRGLGLIQSFLGESVQAARDYNSATAGLSAATSAYGESAAAARAEALALSSDGIIPITSSAKALQNLMSTGLGMDQSIELIQTFMDRAAFGRNRTIQFGTAIENLTQAFRTEQSELSDASGMTENYSQILEVGANQLGKTVESLNQAERAQAKFLGIQQLSAAQAGNYARYLETDAAAQDRYNYRIEETQRLLGAAINPAVAVAQEGFGSLIQSLGITDSNMKNVQASIVTLVAVAQTAGNVLLGMADSILAIGASAFTLSLDPLEKSAQRTTDRILDTALNWQKSIDRIATSTADSLIDESERANTEVADLATKAQRDMLRDIDEANRTFARSQEQRLAQFQQSLKDMVIAHRDKSQSIRTDIAAEDKAYAESVRKREKDYQKDVENLEDRHAEKVEDITKKITEERERGIVVDGRLYANANQERLNELENELTQETQKHNQALAERKRQYQADVAEDKARHNAKRQQLQTELAAELAILNRHRGDVARVGNAQKEDDITRLKAQFAAANKEAERNHQEQLVRIRQRGTDQGAGYVNGFANGVRKERQNLEQTFETTFAQAIKGIDKGLKSGGLTIGSGPAPKKGFLEWLGGAFSDLFRADGGPVTGGRPYIVGEREPELFVPNQSGRILNQEQMQRAMGNQQGMTVNIKEQHFHSEMDQTSFLRRMYWEARR